LRGPGSSVRLCNLSWAEIKLLQKSSLLSPRAHIN